MKKLRSKFLRAFLRGRSALILAAAVSLVFLVVRPATSALTLNFTNLVGTQLDFSGAGTFSFSSIGGYQFVISSESGGDGDAVGFDGYVSPGGPYTIGTITTIGSIETAPVTGTGTLHITDGSSTDLTGTIQWDDITTLGVGGILNLSGTINLTTITYPGSSNDLSALAAAGSAADVVTFQFVPAETLTQLKTTAISTSYSGTIAVPEPATLTLFGSALLLLGGFRWQQRRRRAFAIREDR